MRTLNILNLDTKALVTNSTGKVVEVIGAAEAKSMVEQLIANTGQRHQLRLAKAEDAPNDSIWHERESKRQTTEYKGVGDIDRVFERISVYFKEPKATEHAYPHASKKSPGKIAYTPNSEYGHADRQKIASVDDYIKFQYPDSDTSRVANTVTIKHLKNKLSLMITDCKLVTITSSADIAAIYKGTAVRSCMTGDDFEAASPHHPADCFGTPGNVFLEVMVPTDLAAASPADIASNPSAVIGRCLVHRDYRSRIFTHAEGLADTMAGLLKAKGFKKDSEGTGRDLTAGFQETNVLSAFEGAKLNLLYSKRGPAVCPYLDMVGCVEKTSDGFLTITSDGSFEAMETSGIVRAPIRCYDCEEEFDGEDLVEADTGELMCEHCANAEGYAFCDGAEHYTLDKMIDLDRGSFSLSWLENNAVKSDLSGRWAFWAGNTGTVVMADGTTQTWLTSELEAAARYSELDDRWFLNVPTVNTIGAKL